MAIRNKELVDRTLVALDGKFKTFRFLINRNGSKDEFKKTLEEAENILEDLTAMIERDTSPLRNG
tara:strand:- start:87 stop:281 length:195 start_codon:yes stop_codon:yes gene_type:complete